MTIYAKEIVLARIKAAEPYSPIAVFDTGMVKDGVEQYDSIFAQTAMFKLKRKNDKGLVGVFHKYTPEKQLAFLK